MFDLAKINMIECKELPVKKTTGVVASKYVFFNVLEMGLSKLNGYHFLLHLFFLMWAKCTSVVID